jgi:hypothetical protein
MSLKHPTIIESVLMDLFKETLDLSLQTANAYFSITRGGTVSKRQLLDIKLQAKHVLELTERMI